MMAMKSTHLHERVDSHDGHVGLGLCVVHQVQIDELLELQVVGLHTVDDIWEERRDVFADRHACDDLLYRLLLLFFLVIVELGLQLEDLALLGGCEVL